MTLAITFFSTFTIFADPEKEHYEKIRKLHSLAEHNFSIEDLQALKHLEHEVNCQREGQQKTTCLDEALLGQDFFNTADEVCLHNAKIRPFFDGSAIIDWIDIDWKHTFSIMI